MTNRAHLSTRESQATFATPFNLGGNHSAMNFGRVNNRPSEDKTFMGEASKMAGQSSAQNGNMGYSAYLRIESEKSSFHTRMNDSSMMQQALGARSRVNKSSIVN